MSGEEDDLTELFRQEANSIIDSLSTTLIRMERGDPAGEAKTEALRHLHTLKGMANMEGHPDLARLCHDGETMLTRSEEPPVDTLLRRVDELRVWMQENGYGVRSAEGGPGTAYVTVQVERLDRLLNITGELTVASTRLAYEEHTTGVLPETLRTLTTLVRTLQDEVMKTRLLPAQTLFAGLPRLVRDTAKARGVEVDLVLDEGQIALDRSIVDRLGGVLAHLVQNSVAHGIEPAGARLAQGKPARGKVRVSLRRDQENVVVEFSDDGRGLAYDDIRRKAIERGLLAAQDAAHATHAALGEIVFAPGFSTLDTADGLSGRGIGLTAVRDTLRELGGGVRLASEPGEGTRFTLHLPPTVALLETLVAEVEGRTLALPLRNVRRIHALGDARDIAGRLALIDRGGAIPILTLSGGPVAPGTARFAVVIEGSRGIYALAVDALRGTHSTLLKSLDPRLLETQPNAMGAAVLGSGTLAIIVDPNHYPGRA